MQTPKRKPEGGQTPSPLHLQILGSDGDQQEDYEDIHQLGLKSWDSGRYHGESWLNRGWEGAEGNEDGRERTGHLKNLSGDHRWRGMDRNNWPEDPEQKMGGEIYQRTMLQ